MSATSKVLLLQHGPVAEVRLNRPDKLNALDDDCYDALADAFGRAAADTSVRAVLLSAEGEGFCAGSDIGGMARQDLAAARRKLAQRHRAVLAVAGIEKPVVAALQGAVAGIGTSFAMACDLAVAAEDAYFLFAFRNVALVPDGGAVHFLTQRIGVGRAKDLVFRAERLGAREAKDWGLVNRVVPCDALQATALALATELAAGPTLTFGLTKRMFATATAPGLQAALDIEAMAAGVARLSDDHAEGVSAFRQKRKPEFRGH